VGKITEKREIHKIIRGYHFHMRRGRDIIFVGEREGNLFFGHHM
jgi:hypothetical protein